MAEKDEEEGLDLLIAQRGQRPSYARMISWEFKEPEASNHRRRRRSKRQSGDTSVSRQEVHEDDGDWIEGEDDCYDSEDDLSLETCNSVYSTSNASFGHSETFLSHKTDEGVSSEDESMYFSAEEVIIDSESEDSVKCDNQNVENAEVFDGLLAGGSASCSQRHRAPSKKQKRKRRKYMLTYGNDLKPFSNFDFDINSDLESSLQKSAADIDLLKPVPSLIELCMKSVHQNVVEFIPKSMKHMFECSYIDNSFRKFQLMWLHGILAQFEPEKKFVQEIMYDETVKFGKKKTYYSEKICKLLIPTRNAWNSENFPKYIAWSIKNYKGCELSASLPHSNMLYYMDSRYTSSIGTKGMADRTGFRILAVLASTLDLMMPRTISPYFGRRRHNSSTERERTSKAVMSLMAHLKYAMNKRFPTVVEHCFDMVIPYVFWARGDVQHATDYFTSLSQKETEGKFKAFYLNEVGRMYAQVGDKESAVHFYHLAAEAVMENLLQMSSSDQITTQKLMLIANIFDQGPMTTEKAKNAAKAWQSVITSPYLYSTENLQLHVMDSYLCIHCGNFNVGEGREWLEDARCRLVALSENEPHLLYYLSMVLALLGDDKESHGTYWEYLKTIKGGPNSPGMDMVTMLGFGKKGNPWQVLLDTVREITTGTPFLKVVWRTQLGPLMTANQSFPVEADLCNKPLNLRFDDEGNITGDLQMMLPPIRAISLNPYTGFLMFSLKPSKTEVWNSTRFYDDSNLHPENFVTPTLVELKGEVVNPGYKVYLCMAKKVFPSSNSCQETDFATLIWTGENGERVRLNIIRKMREFCFEKCKAAIETQKSYGRYKKPTWRADAMLILRKAKSKGCDMSFNRISEEARRYGKTMKAAQQEIEEKERKKETVPKSLRKTASGKDFEIRLPSFKLKVLNNIQFLGNKLLLSVFHQYLDYLLVIDCSSKESFLNPKILDGHSEQKLCIKNRKEYFIPGSEQRIVRWATSLKFISDEGTVVDNIDLNRHLAIIDLTRSTNIHVAGKKVVGVSANQRLWSTCDNELVEHAEVASVYDMDQVGDVFILQRQEGISFIKTHDVQPLVQPPFLRIFISAEYRGLPLTLNGEKTHICLKGKAAGLNLIGERQELRNGHDVYRAAVAVGNIVLIVFVPVNTNVEVDCELSVELLMAIELPGSAVEACFVSQQAGVLVSWTQHPEDSDKYREHLSQYDYNGQLLGMLPFLGRGPRSFLPVFLPGDGEIQARYPECGQSGWYVFIRDGHDGIMGVKLYPY